MGQQIAVVAKPSSNPGVVRFEANRNLTGQGHEVFHSAAEAMGTRPAAVLARRLLDTGRVDTVHVFGNMITVDVAKGFDASGLEDVVATSSRICFLDGDRGVLAYCGHDIHDLARHATFEETCYLLWHGRLPNRAELGDLQSQLAAARRLPEPILRFMKMLPPSDGMDALRSLTSLLGHYDPDAHDNSLAASYRKAVRLTAQISTIVATWGRMQDGGGPIDPDPAMGHAANFLYMLTGQRPGALETRAFDVALILHADHELNASTFAARVAAATLTDIHSAMVGAI